MCLYLMQFASTILSVHYFRHFCLLPPKVGWFTFEQWAGALSTDFSMLVSPLLVCGFNYCAGDRGTEISESLWHGSGLWGRDPSPGLSGPLWLRSDGCVRTWHQHCHFSERTSARHWEKSVQAWEKEGIELKKWLHSRSANQKLSSLTLMSIAMIITRKHLLSCGNHFLRGQLADLLGLGARKISIITAQSASKFLIWQLFV